MIMFFYRRQEKAYNKLVLPPGNKVVVSNGTKYTPLTVKIGLRLVQILVLVSSNNPLPDDKILDWSKFKQLAGNMLKCI